LWQSLLNGEVHRAAVAVHEQKGLVARAADGSLEVSGVLDRLAVDFPNDISWLTGKIR